MSFYLFPVSIPTVRDSRGSLTYTGAEEEAVPFKVRRVFWIHSAEAPRGGHAHRTCEQFLVAVSGVITVTLKKAADDYVELYLSRPTEGLYIQPGVWVDLTGFGRGAVLLVLASHPYDEKDYIRDWEEFLAWSPT